MSGGDLRFRKLPELDLDLREQAPASSKDLLSKLLTTICPLLLEQGLSVALNTLWDPAVSEIP